MVGYQKRLLSLSVGKDYDLVQTGQLGCQTSAVLRRCAIPRQRLDLSTGEILATAARMRDDLVAQKERIEEQLALLDAMLAAPPVQSEVQRIRDSGLLADMFDMKFGPLAESFGGESGRAYLQAPGVPQAGEGAGVPDGVVGRSFHILPGPIAHRYVQTWRHAVGSTSRAWVRSRSCRARPDGRDCAQRGHRRSSRTWG